jgi:ADP-ribose pyrophosphatase YjhB (NUDIX family)
MAEPGSPSFSKKVPTGDNRERLVCDGCGFVDYVNPKIVVGAVCTWEDRVLLCRRAIEPRRGYWTMPAGFMEERESVDEGAAREAMEEAGADIEIGPLLGVWSVPRISQVHMMFVARMRSPHIEAGEESLEVRFFAWSEIPWADLAFPSVVAALRRFQEVRGRDSFEAFVGPLGER